MKLISVEEAKSIAAKQIGGDVSFRDVELEDEHDDYPGGGNFMPVYKLECFSGGKEYDVEIDAVTGKVLKCKLDD